MTLLKRSENWNNDRPAAARILGRARTVEAVKALQSWILLFSSSHFARSRASLLGRPTPTRPRDALAEGLEILESVFSPTFSSILIGRRFFIEDSNNT